MNASIAVNLSTYTIAFIALVLFVQIPHVNESAGEENETCWHLQRTVIKA